MHCISNMNVILFEKKNVMKINIKIGIITPNAQYSFKFSKQYLTSYNYIVKIKSQLSQS